MAVGKSALESQLQFTQGFGRLIAISPTASHHLFSALVDFLNGEEEFFRMERSGDRDRSGDIDLVMGLAGLRDGLVGLRDGLEGLLDGLVERLLEEYECLSMDVECPFGVGDRALRRNS